MPEDNINLMPEDLRKAEQTILSKQNSQAAPNILSTPNASPEALADQPSGDTGDSWLHKVFTPNSQPLETTPVQTTAPQSTGDNSGFKLAEQGLGDVNNSGFHQPEKIIRARFVEDASGVDLVPQLSKVKSWKQIGSLAVITLLASAGVVVVFYFGLLTWNSRLTIIGEKTKENIQITENALVEFEESVKRINNTGQEIQRVYDLLNKHIYWTNFFALLEKYTLPEVRFSGFAATNSGTLTLNANAPDYATMAKQLKILQTENAKEFVTEVEISGGTKSDTGVNFSVSLVLNPDLFYYQTNQ